MVPLGPFRVISLGEGTRGGGGAGRKLSNTGRSSCSWEAPRISPHPHLRLISGSKHTGAWAEMAT